MSESDIGTVESFEEEPQPKKKNPSKKKKANKTKKRKGKKQKANKKDIGTSKVEMLAKRIEDRQKDRIEITLKARKAFVEGCRAKADKSGLGEVYRISSEDLKALKKETAAIVDAKGPISAFNACIGFRDTSVQMLMVLEKAEEVVQENDVEDWFYYQDFNTTYTKVIPKYPWMRSGGGVTLFWLVLYYAFTPLLFCSIKDANICPDPFGDPLGSWLTTSYYASTTLSTVGYGDFSPDTSTWYGALIGTLFMILSNIVLIVILNSLLTLEYFQKGLNMCAKNRLSSCDENEFLHKKINRFRNMRYIQVLLYFTIVNLVGLGFHLFLNNGTDTLTDPDFAEIMRGMYWAVQTTTTIGYGDLDSSLVSDSDWQKIFLTFYLIFSTAFVAQAFGLLKSLNEDVEEARLRFAWERRNVSKALIAEIAADDDVVDQYEFVLASLVQLKKASTEDIEEIMTKFRALTKGADTLSAMKYLADQQASNAELKKEMNSKYVAEI